MTADRMGFRNGLKIYEVGGKVLRLVEEEVGSPQGRSCVCVCEEPVNDWVKAGVNLVHLVPQGCLTS